MNRHRLGPWAREFLGVLWEDVKYIALIMGVASVLATVLVVAFLGLTQYPTITFPIVAVVVWIVSILVRMKQWKETRR